MKTKKYFDVVASTEKPLRIVLGHCSYAIHVGPGLLDSAGMMIAPLLRQPRAFIISDVNTAPLYLERLIDSLVATEIVVSPIILPAGEQTKSFPFLEYLLESLLTAHCERYTTLIALGGGVIGDLVGFTASIILRGIDFIQIPTTLLAQVDSAVGGKTGIDTKYGKNLVGTFYQPRLVVSDTVVLDTLPSREIKSGYAEIVKYGCVNSPIFFNWLETNGPRLLAGDIELRRHAILESCAAKARIVSADEREGSSRALLNFGHTFGHALEAETGFSQELTHGEAIAIGMMLAFRLSVRLGICHPSEADRLERHLVLVGLPVTIRQAITHPISVDHLLTHMARDKKVHNGCMRLVLTTGIGHAAVTHATPFEELIATLNESSRD